MFVALRGINQLQQFCSMVDYSGLVLFSMFYSISTSTGVDLGSMAIKGTLHSPKLQHCWNLAIRLFSVISRIFVGGSYPSAEVQSVYSTGPDYSGVKVKKNESIKQRQLHSSVIYLSIHVSINREYDQELYFLTGNIKAVIKGKAIWTFVNSN